MKKNIGTPDRLARLALGVLLLIGAYVWHSWLLALLGAFVVYESVSGWCVLYALLGRNTCPMSLPSEKKK